MLGFALSYGCWRWPTASGCCSSVARWPAHRRQRHRDGLRG
ncbi:hypothetical protein P4110_11200 [Pseudomonas aeruginosa]|nr:hypothetical protein [Pseudomonas aeruginosa]